MTKSGVGTTTQANMSGQGQTTSPEIPIWVSDRKKWVTGISKKTTINDIIYAILKQCQINCDYEYINEYVLVEITYSLTTTNDSQPNLNDSQHHHHHQNFIINSERVLKGNSKVYKYLSKWIETSNKLILKVKKCEFVQFNENNDGLNQSLSSASSSATATAIEHHPNHYHNNNSTLDTTLTGVNNNNNNNTNTITKFFKKLTNANNNNNSSNSSTNSNNLNNSAINKQIVKYVDVKLPVTQQQQQQQQQQHLPQSNSSNQINNNNNGPYNQSTLTRVSKAGIVPIASLQQQQQQQQQFINDYELDCDQSQMQTLQQQQKLNEVQLPYKQYDPTLQKTLIVSNILDKDKKLNQQFERVKLLDELIKEAEKTLIMNENYYLSSQQFIEEQNQVTCKLGVKKPSNLNLNDIYSCFPEMYTHGSNEVEEFQSMCTKLLSLDDNVNHQKQILNKLELDIQKELIINNTAVTATTANNNENENLDDLLQISSLLETPETAKLKKEVTQSREQTRVQCKELHDLDLRMRQNESVLVHKENELKTLLEELYLHEIYLDSVNTETINNKKNNNNNPTQMSYVQKTATLTATQAAKNSKLKTLASVESNNNNNTLSSSSTSTSSSSSASLTPPINEHLINKSSISSINTIVSQQQKQQISPIAPPPPLPTSLPPSQIPMIKTTKTANAKPNDHCDNDSGISSMSSENDANLMHNSKMPQYIQIQQQSAKSVMETLV